MILRFYEKDGIRDIGVCTDTFMLLIRKQAMVMAFFQGLRTVPLALPKVCVWLCLFPELTPLSHAGHLQPFQPWQ